MIPLNLKPPSPISTSNEYSHSGEYYSLKRDNSIPQNKYDEFFNKLESIYMEDLVWNDRSESEYKFMLRGKYLSRILALKEYNFPGCPIGIFIHLKKFSFYTDDLIKMSNIDILNIECDEEKYNYTYKNLDDFEKEIQRWCPPNLSEYIYDIECLRCFSKYRLGYRTSIEIYNDVKSLMRMERIDSVTDISKMYLD